jgi:hypothetical protein
MFEMSQSLERAVARFRKVPDDGERDAIASRISAAAFRARVEQRMRNLERDIGELKGRLNGLIFVVIGAVITQVVLKVAA